jgi:hypothetical protein
MFSSISQVVVVYHLDIPHFLYRSFTCRELGCVHHWAINFSLQVECDICLHLS